MEAKKGDALPEKFIHAAAGRIKCDLVLKNARFVNVFGGTVEEGDIAIVGDRIVGTGAYGGEREIDVAGFTVLPAYIDAHVHIESSQLSPEEFASLVVPRGTATVIADPHEIVNVCGLAGAEYIAKACEPLPLDVKVQLPSCVPATPYETSGAVLSSRDVAQNIGNPYVYGLGEFMNYPAVIAAEPEALTKLGAAYAAGKIVDGHAPALSGKDLNAYLCGGISTDHECVSCGEIGEKVGKGMYVHLRHGSAMRNLEANCKAVNASNMRRFLLCTDDRHAADLKEKGHIDDALRHAVAAGLDPVGAVTIATLNAAECYGLKYRGAVAPFYYADLVVVDNLQNFGAQLVIKDGKIVAEKGKPLFDTSVRYLPDCVKNTVRFRPVCADDFRLKLGGERAYAIAVRAGDAVTRREIVTLPSAEGDVVLRGSGVLKLAVVERHKMTGNIGKGLIKGYGFHGGAMGTTVAHDSHNVILLGDDNASMAKVANELARIGGGMAVADGKTGEVFSLPLDIGGLMSSRGAESFCRDSKALAERAYAMGVDRGQDAFMSLAFLSLAVIPEIRLLDTGLFDVQKFAFTELEPRD